jgi:hypothetical protein
MNWLVAGSEIMAGILLFAGTVAAVMLLRPREGLQERIIVRFPGAWIIVGLLLTCSFAVSVALVAVGTGVLE